MGLNELKSRHCQNRREDSYKRHSFWLGVPAQHDQLPSGSAIDSTLAGTFVRAQHYSDIRMRVINTWQELSRALVQI
jgi:hypothetical protein